MKIIKGINKNLGDLILTSRGFESSVGTRIVFNGMKRLRLSMQSRKIMIFSYPFVGNNYVIGSCMKIGFNKTDIYFYNQHTSPNCIMKMDYIYISAGNTFAILQFLKKNVENFSAIKKAVFKGTNYIGVSAGAMIAGTDIFLASEFDRNDVLLNDLDGLRLYEGTTIPHYGKKEFKRFKKLIDYKIDGYKYIYSVSDKGCIIMEGNRPFK